MSVVQMSMWTKADLHEKHVVNKTSVNNNNNCRDRDHCHHNGKNICSNNNKKNNSNNNYNKDNSYNSNSNNSQGNTTKNINKYSNSVNIPLKNAAMSDSSSPPTRKRSQPQRQLPYQDGFNSSYYKIESELDTLLQTGEVEADPNSRPIILHAGCGVGVLPERIDFTKYGCYLHGVDVSPVSIEVAKRKGRYKELTVCSLDDELPYPSGYFDMVIANGTLGYCVSNKPLYDFVRVLKRGGYIVMVMRLHHFQDRMYPDAIMKLERLSMCRPLRQSLFSAFPSNHDFNHEYLYTLLQKI